MASVNQTRPHCVNKMGKTHSKPLAARHGRGTAWARRAMCESAFKAPLHVSVDTVRRCTGTPVPSDVPHNMAWYGMVNLYYLYCIFMLILCVLFAVVFPTVFRIPRPVCFFSALTVHWNEHTVSKYSVLNHRQTSHGFRIERKLLEVMNFASGRLGRLNCTTEPNGILGWNLTWK